MSTFSHVAVEMRPATIASFVHVVASHQELRTHHRHVFPVLDLQSVLSDLGERHGVTASAMALITMFACEIIATNVSPIEVVWYLVVGNRLCIWVFLLELLCLLNGSLEVCTLTKRNLSDWLR